MLPIRALPRMITVQDYPQFSCIFEKLNATRLAACEGIAGLSYMTLESHAPGRGKHVEINDSTRVKVPLWQLLVFVGGAIVSIVTITAFVLSYIQTNVTDKIAKSEVQLNSSFTALNNSINQIGNRLSSIEASIKDNDQRDREREAATQARLVEFAPWSWKVTHDLQVLGRAAKIDLETKEPPKIH